MLERFYWHRGRVGQTIDAHHATIKEYIKIAQAALICFKLPIYSKSTLKSFMNAHPKVNRAILFYEGNKTNIYDKIHILPAATLFS